MVSEKLQQQKSFQKLGKESDLSLEVVILIILGIFMLIFGIVLFEINTGKLPYNPDSAYGLFLVLVAVQIITMGKTPLGDLRRSWILILTGICIAIVGMISCFISGLLTEIVRLLVGVILLVGGINLLIQLFTSKKKAKTWLKNPGILTQLTIACGLVYVIMIILGLITLLPGVTTNPQTALFLIIYGFSIFYLAWCIQKVVRLYLSREIRNPALNLSYSDENASKKPTNFFQEASLPLNSALLILLGVLITLLGALLVLVTQGLLSFSADGTYGLLMVIFAIQIMTLGKTPVSSYKRSWLLVIIGIVFASFGIFSCIVPGILTGVIYLLIGVLNILGGTISLITMFYPILCGIRNPPEEEVVLPSIIKKLLITNTMLNIGTIAFGLSMLLIGIVPAIVTAGILVIYGLLFFILVSFLQQKIDEKDEIINYENPSDTP
ncbi:hypothetical protein [Methanobacterium ferruginis]|uniref:hypothetical protein n=1 Tax=Methanobacterium ferruginis TaxID=710191 RepID=UPI0025730401|nr:hypothetical protein [Methanobacterium ferruginis]BDZ69226.1 hypothetical protein GCM10025860_26740 [Methanobacterium ferruginis]